MEMNVTNVDGLDSFDGALDWTRLHGWIAQSEAPGSGPVTAVEKLRGGLQNAVFKIERGDQTMILRRPPMKIRDGHNATMLREARILTALRGSDVPHPEVYAVCDDDSVTGASFYLMEALEGFAKSGDLPAPYSTEPKWRRAMGEELVKAAVALGAFNYEAAGLGDLGKPDNWHVRQVERWRSQLEGYAATPGYNPADLPFVEEVGRWLSDNVPQNQRIGIVHGDFQFPNIMFSGKAPKISGVLDWELASLGDPLLDLGWILSSWSEEGDPEGKSPMVKPWDGFLTRKELVDLYGSYSRRNMAEMPWFFALACYKLAVLLEGTTAAWKAGKVPENVGQSVHGYATWLMTKARQIIAG
jgi:aminoglycoside phosphotransferase (APT) family kinase protein